MRIIFLIFVLFFAFASPSLANHHKVETFTLENGMQVVLIPNTKVPAVSHMVWYKTGSQDEQPGKTGLAHFLEHLMFKGTKEVGKGQFSKIIAKSGGDDNAFTYTDYTAYFQNISKDKLELVMRLESDRMQNLIFDNEEVLKEREVILEERSSRTDNDPDALLREQMKAAMYLNHPYHNPIIGWRHEMETLSLQDAKNWYESYYAPNNAVLIVSGDVTLQELKPLAEKYYGQVKKKKVPPRRILEEPKQIAARSITLIDSKVEKPEWARYYLAPSQNTQSKEHCYALIVLSRMLGDSNTSRLYQKLVTEGEIAASVGSYYEDLMLGNSVFAVYGLPSGAHTLDEIGAAIDKEIEEIKKNGVTDKELERARNFLISDTIYAQEDLKNLAYIYGQALSTGAGIDYVANWEKNIAAVTKEQVQAAANAIFRPESSVTGRLLKK